MLRVNSGYKDSYSTCPILAEKKSTSKSGGPWDADLYCASSSFVVSPPVFPEKVFRLSANDPRVLEYSYRNTVIVVVSPHCALTVPSRA